MYDEDGVAVKYLGDVGTQAWAGNTYRIGSVALDAVYHAIRLGGWWAVRDANISGNKTATEAQ